METVVYIPSNYTDAGKLFGMFEIRNTIECVVLCLPLLWLIFCLTPFGITPTLIIAFVFVVPLGGFALMGISDHSLFTFLRLYKKWKKDRCILLYRGSEKITYKEVIKCQK